MPDATIVVVARDAEATIERALRSAVAQGPYPIVVVDDGSGDRTAERAASVAPGRTDVRRLSPHRTLGFARQRALEAVQTEFAIWLDADDEMLTGRADRLVAALGREGTDLAFDGAEVWDGPMDTRVGVQPIPGFLRTSRVLARLFERNYLPVLGPLACRTACLRGVGYDETMHGAEDLDVVLRAVAAGAEASLLPDIGYRVYACPGSLSHQGAPQRRMTRYSLLKHDYALVEALYRRAGVDPRVTRWGLVSMAVFREDWPVAVGWLDELEGACRAPDRITEPDGPCPYPEGWRLNFVRGTVDLLRGCPDSAVERLRLAERYRQSAEGANNLGVASYRSGHPAQAVKWFETARARYPQYLDASHNLTGPVPDHVTTHPFRAATAARAFGPGR